MSQWTPISAAVELEITQSLPYRTQIEESK